MPVTAVAPAAGAAEADVEMGPRCPGADPGRRESSPDLHLYGYPAGAARRIEEDWSCVRPPKPLARLHATWWRSKADCVAAHPVGTDFVA